MVWNFELGTWVGSNARLGHYTVFRRAKTGWHGWLHREPGESLQLIVDRDLERVQRYLELFDLEAKPRDVVRLAKEGLQ